MQKYNHQLVDWDAFSKYDDEFFKTFAIKIQVLLSTQKIQLGDTELYALFGCLVSENAFTSYLKVNNFEYGQNSGTESHSTAITVNKYELNQLEEGSFLDLGFFHRHDQFNAEFQSQGGNKVTNTIRNLQSAKVNLGHSILQKFGLSDYDPAIIRRLAFVLVNHPLLQDSLSPNLLGSAHGIYSDLGALYLAKAIRNDSKIVIVQPGFIHLQAKFIHQVKYELTLASHYISWGGEREKRNVFPLGSMYSSRTADPKPLDAGAIVLLPQIPRKIPRPFSFYWSHIYDFHPLFDRLIPKLRELKTRHGTVFARCKHLDLERYNNLFKANDIDIPLVGANVNVNSECLTPMEHTYVSYFSTGIAEAFHSGSNVQTLFSDSSYLVSPKFEQDSSCLITNPTNQVLLKKYVEKYAKPVQPIDFIEQLLNLIG